MAQGGPCIAYEQEHSVSVVYDCSAPVAKNVFVRIGRECLGNLTVKVFEVDNFRFNYTCEIDHACFNRMKGEQFLEINFEELQSQIIDLLKETLKNEMFLRLQADNSKCKMVFYEKARLKSLIFLTIDLTVTDQMQIIEEMTRNIAGLKETNHNLSYQLNSVRNEVRNKESLLNSALTTSKMFENQVKKDIQMLEKVFCTTIANLERVVGDKLMRINRRHLKLTNDVEIVKNENKLKCESSVRLVNSMHSLRLENDRNMKTIDDLRMEINHLKILKGNSEETCANSRQTLNKKEREIEELRGQIDELKKDLQDATMIIAQKSRTHDEIAKDLVQANTMLVNFNNQCDNLSKELDESKEIIKRKDKVTKEQAVQLAKLSEEFNKYKTQFNAEELTKVKQELYYAKQSCLDLEKQNKEAIKLNGLLTRKLSAGDATLNARNSTLLPPSQRSNY